MKFTLLALIFITFISAQNYTDDVKLPRKSASASISQRVGITDVTVNYHRPSLKGRELIGKLIPLDKVWRTGANENTTITFSTDVMFGEKLVSAGTYGVHTLPSKNKWTFILSSISSAWGSYSYDKSEDVLRFDGSVKKVASEEQFNIGFDNVTMNSASLFLHWGTVKVTIPFTVKTNELVFTNLKKELRGAAGLSEQGYRQAANFLVQNDIHLDQAMKWIETSIKWEKTVMNLLVKSEILVKLKKADKAKKVFREAIDLAPEKRKERLEKRFNTLFN